MYSQTEPKALKVGCTIMCVIFQAQDGLHKIIFLCPPPLRSDSSKLPSCGQCDKSTASLVCASREREREREGGGGGGGLVFLYLDIPLKVCPCNHWYPSNPNS